ncbi:VP6 [Orbivirus alphaequi]|uniref:VP6 n=1 Tax=African horse sickness virus TaxID=40050 RepID=A0A0D4L713_AHSV|nr:VP6 [African horse sickness virus]
MSSALLLAPGDLIVKAKRELEQRSISSLLRSTSGEPKEEREEKQNNQKDGEKEDKAKKGEEKIPKDGGLGSAKSAEPEPADGSGESAKSTGGDGGGGAGRGAGGRGVGGVAGGAGGRGGSLRGGRDAGLGESTSGANHITNDDATRNAGSGEVPSGGVTSGSSQGGGGGAAASGESGGQPLDRKSGASGDTRSPGEKTKVDGGDRRDGGLATQEIVDYVRKKVGVEVPIYQKGMSNLFTVDRGLLERGGLSKDDLLHQSDIVKEAKANDKKLKVVPLSTVKRIIAEFGGSEEEDVKGMQTQSSSIRYISNRMEDVPKAKAMFTAPTGDEGWKEVAKAATLRPNIMAYVHEGEGDGLKELLHLIDHI